MSEIEDEIRRQMVAERLAAQSAAPAPPINRPSRLEAKRAQGGLLGILAAVGLLLLKFGAPALSLLGKLKFLAFLKTFAVTGGSMLVSMWAYATMFGWWFAVGFVLLIFVHECGHAVAARSLGLKVSPMIFVPFMGAMVGRSAAKNAEQDAYIGIMGPVYGTVGALVCVLLYWVHPTPYWLALAQVTFFLNLFNLLPMPPLDGGWITPVISPKLLVAGIILLFVVAPSNPLIWILGLLSIPRIIHAWKAKPGDPYFLTPPAVRWRYGLAYVGLAGFLAYGNMRMHQELEMLRRPSRVIVAHAEKVTRS